MRVAGVTRGKRGYWKTEEGERAVAISSLRRRLSVMAVKCQASSLLGRLETLGPGGTAALRGFTYSHTSYLSRAPRAVPVEKKSVMWRNFKFLYMTDVEKSKIPPHVD